MGQSIFEAGKKAKTFILASINKTTTVQKTGIVAIKGDDIITFRDVGQAVINAPDGYVFSYIYRNEQVEITPEN